jgi:hypothetical protein
MQEKHTAEHRTDLRPFVGRLDAPLRGDTFAARHPDWTRPLPTTTAAASAASAPPGPMVSAPPPRLVRYYKLGAHRLARLATLASASGGRGGDEGAGSSSSGSGSDIEGGGLRHHRFMHSLDYYGDSQVRACVYLQYGIL